MGWPIWFRPILCLGFTVVYTRETFGHIAFSIGQRAVAALSAISGSTWLEVLGVGGWALVLGDGGPLLR